MSSWLFIVLTAARQRDVQFDLTPALSGFMTGAPEWPVGLLVAQPSSSFAHQLHSRPNRRVFALFGLSHFFAANVTLLGHAAVVAHVFALPIRHSR